METALNDDEFEQQAASAPFCIAGKHATIWPASRSVDLRNVFVNCQKSSRMNIRLVFCRLVYVWPRPRSISVTHERFYTAVDVTVLVCQLHLTVTLVSNAADKQGWVAREPDPNFS